MRIVRELDFRRLFDSPTAVAAGNFDGLHLGHRRILRVLVERAGRAGLRPVVLTFSPHPEKVLGHRQISMIQTLEQRLEGFRSLGVQAVLLAPFDRTLAGLPAADFVERVLLGSLNAREVVVGRDFRFGRGRRGNVRGLLAAGRRLGFRTEAVPPVRRRGLVVSSSLIRRRLAAGAVGEAGVLLGRPYEITGRVVSGSRRGRSLGFPTANLLPDNEILPTGVFLTLAVVEGRLYPAITNIGTRPTFGGGPLQVESYILDFAGNLYRRRLGLRFLRKLRDEQAFATREALAARIERDGRAARRAFERRRV